MISYAMLALCACVICDGWGVGGRSKMSGRKAYVILANTSVACVLVHVHSQDIKHGSMVCIMMLLLASASPASPVFFVEPPRAWSKVHAR